MHELGVLCQAVKTVNRVAEQNRIEKIKHITLEVGEESGFVPMFLEKLFPVAIDQFPNMQGTQLRIRMAPGDKLMIQEIGY